MNLDGSGSSRWFCLIGVMNKEFDDGFMHPVTFGHRQGLADQAPHPLAHGIVVALTRIGVAASFAAVVLERRDNLRSGTTCVAAAQKSL